MSYHYRVLFRAALILIVCFSGFTFVQAQDNDDEEVVVENTVRGEGRGEAVAVSNAVIDDDEDKVTGATIRGRLLYEDSGRPVRYALITLTSLDSDNYPGSMRYSGKFVKTDANGEFVMKNVKPGNYAPYIKSEGILNIDSFVFRGVTKTEIAENLPEKISVDGLGEMQATFHARRGGAINGTIRFVDGEAAVGVYVEALRKKDGIYGGVTGYDSDGSVGKTQTDDRGNYRFAGLPSGQYIVRVVEPVSHTQTKADYLYNFRENSQSSVLKTYFPEGENSKTARELEVSPAQEQTEINIVIPERTLFSVSGKVVDKKTQQPLDKFSVSFQKISDIDDDIAEMNYLSSGASAKSGKLGDWLLKSLPKGKYKISVSQGYVAPAETEKNNVKKPVQYPTVMKEIEVGDENIADLIFEMPAEASIAGTVTVEGGKNLPPDVRIFAVGEKGEVGYSGADYSNYRKNPEPVKQTDFRIRKLAEGKYQISFASREFYLKSISIGGRDVTASRIEVKEGEEIKNIQIVLSDNMGTLKGKVNNFDGKNQMFVVLIKAGMDITRAAAGSFGGAVPPNGNFEIKAAPGEYSVIMPNVKERPKNEAEIKELIEKLLKDAPKVTIKAGETETITLSLPNE